MNLKEIMEQKNFVVVGNTLKEGKYAHRIKQELIKNGYNVSCVHKELKSINEVEGNIDIIDLCVNPKKGIEYLRECDKEYKCVLIQPGAESAEIYEFLNANSIDYLDSCALVGIRKYK